MGEPDIISSGGEGVGGVNWRLIVIAIIAVIILVFVVLFGVRTCGSGSGGAYTVIYSRLDLKDAAEVADRLKELHIPYQIQDEGGAIAVQKDRADEAKLGLAIKGLPHGGVVGFEIFDESRFGATDFDKRIQLIRALSGELSRTISRIDGVENARIQIVVPKTELFATEKSPVTASVMLNLIPKKSLGPEQVRGIIHLVSSSVEGLLPENVMVIDNFGRILSGTEYEIEIKKLEEQKEKEKAAAEQKEEDEEKLAKTASRGVTAEEVLMLELKAEAELEDQLQRRAQLVLNKFYPPNTAVVKVDIELGPTQRESIYENEPLYAVTLGGIRRLSVVILIDNRFEFVGDLKKTTMQAVAGAIGYDRRRGDQIIINRVPFHLASTYQEQVPPSQEVKEEAALTSILSKIKGKVLIIAVVVLVLIIIIILLIILRIRRRARPEIEEEESSVILRERPEAAVSARDLEQARRIADSDPGRLAELVKSWIQEETPKEGE